MGLIHPVLGGGSQALRPRQLPPVWAPLPPPSSSRSGHGKGEALFTLVKCAFRWERSQWGLVPGLTKPQPGVA